MEITGLALVSALWLGLLTSISPCPLATNIAATKAILHVVFQHPEELRQPQLEARLSNELGLVS